jgi:hypothetical protein
VSVDRPFLTAEVARARVGADLDAIDAALAGGAPLSVIKRYGATQKDR